MFSCRGPKVKEIVGNTKTEHSIKLNPPRSNNAVIERHNPNKGFNINLVDTLFKTGLLWPVWINCKIMVVQCNKLI